MRVAGLRGCIRGRKRRTTRHDPLPYRTCSTGTSWPVSPKDLACGHHVNVPTREGFLHLAFILGTHSPRIVGWSMPWRWRYGGASP
jgi:hypothetical protein